MKLSLMLFLFLFCSVEICSSRHSRKINNKKEHHYKLKNQRLSGKGPSKFHFNGQAKFIPPRPKGRPSTAARSLPPAPPNVAPGRGRQQVRPAANQRNQQQYSSGINNYPTQRQQQFQQPRQTQQQQPNNNIRLQDNRWSPIGFKNKNEVYKKKPIYPQKKRFIQQQEKLKAKGLAPEPFQRVDRNHLNIFRNQLNIAAPTLQQVQQQSQQQTVGVPTLPVQQKHDINLGTYDEINGIKIYRFSGNDGRGVYSPDIRNRYSTDSQTHVPTGFESDPNVRPAAPQSSIQWSQALVPSIPAGSRRVEEDKSYNVYHQQNYNSNNKGVTTPAPPFPTIHTTPHPFTPGPVVIINAQSRVDQN